MRVRAIALAVPLVLATACKSTSRQGTGAMAEPPTQDSAAQQASVGGTTVAPLAQDPLFVPGASVRGHAGDQTVIGQIAEAGGEHVTIQTAQGEVRTLQIVPETLIQLDGQDASFDDLAEGQPVYASFDTIEGQEVAVKIRAGDEVAPGLPAEQGTGATGQGTGSSGQGTGSAGQGAPAPDAGWGTPPGTGSSSGTGESSPQR